MQMDRLLHWEISACTARSVLPVVNVRCLSTVVDSAAGIAGGHVILAILAEALLLPLIVAASVLSSTGCIDHHMAQPRNQISTLVTRISRHLGDVPMCSPH
jgi:hypothetical protein